MLAARYDTGAELGGGWRRTLRRRTQGADSIDLAMVNPVSVRVWGRAGATDEDDQPLPPRVDATGQVSIDRLTATVALSAAQVAALGVGQWEFAIIVGNPESGEPEVLTRGYFHVSGSVSDT